MVKRKSLAQKALEWKPEPHEPFAEDRIKFLRYMVLNHCGHFNAIKIDALNEKLFQEKFSRTQFQHNILIPFRKGGPFFIGTGRSGICFINSAEDAHKTALAYAARIRSEQAHLRSLRRVASRNRLFDGYSYSGTDERHVIYFDESGRPTVDKVAEDPIFIVTGIVVPASRPGAELRQQFDYIRSILGKHNDFEFSSTQLNKKQYAKVVKQLLPLDFEFASICFDKSRLTGEGFRHPKSFYKFAYQFLVSDLLNYCGQADLIFDEYGGKNSNFQNEFFSYLRASNIGFPIGTLKELDMFSSASEPFIQLADIISGIIKNRVRGKFDLLPFIEEKAIRIDYFPPL